MTVSELIAALSDLPPDALALIENDDGAGSYLHINGVTLDTSGHVSVHFSAYDLVYAEQD